MLVRFLSQFNNLLIYVLLGSAVVTALLQHWVDTGVILAVVLINAVFGFVQEGRAEKALDAVKAMVSSRANVLRDGLRRRCLPKNWWPATACCSKPAIASRPICACCAPAA
jgi:magnesium-transporting ATPase (P-type)